jgi:hypothetical protein
VSSDGKRLIRSVVLIAYAQRTPHHDDPSIVDDCTIRCIGNDEGKLGPESDYCSIQPFDRLRQPLASDHDVLWHRSVSEQLNLDYHARIAPEPVTKQDVVEVITVG